MTTCDLECLIKNPSFFLSAKQYCIDLNSKQEYIDWTGELWENK